MTSIPQVGWVGKWAKVYDPRKDTTYPGGSGAHRSGDEATWEWSENPYLHALTWLIGRRQNGKMMLGVGAPIAGIIVDQFVEGANVADANGWTMAGVVYSTDDKWNVLKLILQAGGGEPLRLGAQIGCLVYTPKVSLATISVGDVVGDATVQATQSRRDRINAVVPRYMVEQGVTTYQSTSNTTTYAYNLQTATSWGIQPASPVIVPEYVAFDGKVRQKEIEFSLVTQLNQAVQLARYAIENAREFGPITLPLKLRWMGYKPGDVVTANLPELGLNGQDILLLNRALSPQNGTVTMTARSETAAKHAFALGQTGTAPPTPSVSGKPLLPIPGPAAWAATGGVVTAANGTTQPVINLVGAVDAEAVDSVVIEYRTSTGSLDTTAGWTTATSLPAPTQQFALTGLRDNGYYDVAVSYRCGPATGDRLILGPVSCGVTNVPWLGVVGVGRPQDGATRNVPRGEWNAITLYGQGDIVTYLGSSYPRGRERPGWHLPDQCGLLGPARGAGSDRRCWRPRGRRPDRRDGAARRARRRRRQSIAHHTHRDVGTSALQRKRHVSGRRHPVQCGHPKQRHRGDRVAAARRERFNGIPGIDVGFRRYLGRRKFEPGREQRRHVGGRSRRADDSQGRDDRVILGRSGRLWLRELRRHPDPACCRRRGRHSGSARREWPAGLCACRLCRQR